MGLPPSPALLGHRNLPRPLRRAPPRSLDPDLQGRGHDARDGLGAAVPGGVGSVVPAQRRPALRLRAAASGRMGCPRDDPADPVPRAVLGRPPVPVPDGALRLDRVRHRRAARARAARPGGRPRRDGPAASRPPLLRPGHPICGRRDDPGRCDAGALLARLSSRGAHRPLAPLVSGVGAQGDDFRLAHQLREVSDLHARRPVREHRDLGGPRDPRIRPKPARLGTAVAGAGARTGRLAPLRHSATLRHG